MALKKKQREFLTYLEKTMGVVTPAVKSYGLIVARTHYKWYAECEEYRKAVDEIRNVADDFVESKLMKLIQDGDTKATIFYAKTRLKHRGYIEKTDVDITTGGKPIDTHFQIEVIRHREQVDAEDNE